MSGPVAIGAGWLDEPSALVWLSGALVGVLVALLVRSTWRLRRSLDEVLSARAALLASEARYRAFAEGSSAGLLVLRGTKIASVNPALCRITGLTEAELLGLEQLDIIHPDDRPTVIARALARQRGEPAPSNYEIRILRKDGAVRWVEVNASRLLLDGEPVGIGTLFDVTERHETVEKMRQSEQLHRLLADNASDVIWVMGLDGKFQYVSPSVEKLRGYTVAEVMAQPMDQVLMPTSLPILHQGLADAFEAVSNGLPFPQVRTEVEQPCKDGSTVWTEVTASGMTNERGEFVGILGVTRDISERRQSEQRFRHQAEHDILTGLPNRALLMDRVGAALQAARRDSHDVALLFLDLDHFKAVNDARGHAIGDQLLRAASERMQNRLRAKDTVARVGGDEFVILLPHVESAAAAGLVAEKLRAALSEPFNLDGQRVNVSASVGLALFPDHAADADGLKRHADVAMYVAKAGGRNRVVVWEPALVSWEGLAVPSGRGVEDTSSASASA